MFVALFSRLLILTHSSFSNLSQTEKTGVGMGEKRKCRYRLGVSCVNTDIHWKSTGANSEEEAALDDGFNPTQSCECQDS